LDGGYDQPPWIHWCKTRFGVVVPMTRRRADQGFQVLPKPWVVEPTFGWLNRWRRLSKAYEALPEVSENMIYIAMIHLMLRRLHPSITVHYLPKTGSQSFRTSVNHNDMQKIAWLALAERKTQN
jgi:putative transposase